MFNSMPSPSLSGAAGPNDRDGKYEILYLTNGKTIMVESRDPYGFWHFKWDKGQVPNSLDQAFTSKAEAMKALRRYISMELYDVDLSPVKVELPELKTKNDKKNA